MDVISWRKSKGQGQASSTENAWVVARWIGWKDIPAWNVCEHGVVGRLEPHDKGKALVWSLEGGR